MSDLERAIVEVIEKTQIVDVHTHLFPPSHGDLLLWGIDESLSYHYLVSELFMVIPSSRLTPQQFFNLQKTEQANIIWKELFCNRTPLSEACRGVITTLVKLGLKKETNEARISGDLTTIRDWFSKQNSDSYLQKIFKMTNIKYAIMTNAPFDPEETKHWKENKPVPECLKFAIRVDDLLKGNWQLISECLEKNGYDVSLEGCRKYLNDWVKLMKPIYLMASTPSGFKLEEQTDNSKKNNGYSGSVLFEEVLVAVAKQNNLALAIKIGARRSVNPHLRTAGDGVEVFDLSFLIQVCQKFPELKLLVTVLSRVNQHELCVIARKFSNLHIYGCWWFCNNPSIIEEVTKMRIEMLGSCFTAQHSDARVLDQIIYKWEHSKKVIAKVLYEKYKELVETGFDLKIEDISRDVQLLFGGSFEQFLEK